MSCRSGAFSIPLLIVFAIIGTLILVECCRRVVGMPIICVATVFVLYAFFGAGKDLKTVMYNLFYTTTGILGTPIGVCSTYIALFVIFGAFLEATGVANFFIDCANALVGWASGVLQRSRSFPPLCAAWSPVPPSVTPLPPVPSPSR